MEELAEIPGAALLLRRRDLLAHQPVVYRALDVAEDADRRRALRRVRDPGEREREARLLVVLVVDEQRVLAHLRHGEPITWGDKGVRLLPDGSPEVVAAADDGLLVHDAHALEPAHASALSRMTQQSIGATPMGVFRAVERPVYDELMAEQIGVAKAKGEGELAALLGSGDTWSIR